MKTIGQTEDCAHHPSFKKDFCSQCIEQARIYQTRKIFEEIGKLRSLWYPREADEDYISLNDLAKLEVRLLAQIQSEKE